MATKTKKITNAQVNVALQIKGIELLNSGLWYPPSEIDLNHLKFDVHLESQFVQEEKSIYVIVNVQVKNTDESLVLGGVTVSCIYFIENFEDVMVQLQKKIPTTQVDALLHFLAETSISTTRGIMYETFRGTFLHHAVLPIIDHSKSMVKTFGQTEDKNR